ncbi:proline racemase family protein [Halostella pelagica]|uniref:proline racemase family protein n=1 Tax=Halostella pelagica TaxID=2583824 RepID=UPI001081FD1D|nr:proline racemase family protein [Halostella pelagica]
MDVNWSPPEQWTTISTIDAHTGGEPLRIVTDGLPSVEGDTMLEKRRYMENNLDQFRKAIILEPRGHADMYGAVVTEPVTDDADFGVLFLHNEGYSTMCGHGVIALAKVAVETEFVEAETPVTTVAMDTPAGLVTARVQVDERGNAGTVTFENVPSFVVETDCSVEVPELGSVEYDLAFGGAFYAYCDAADLGVDLDSDSVGELVDAGRAIKAAVSESRNIEHPFEDDLSFLYGTIIRGEPENSSADTRNVCIFADGEVDRCPTGTGVSGRVALQSHRGRLAPTEELVVESIVGSEFTGTYEETESYGGYDAVLPNITGNAYLTGQSQFVLDPADPFQNGFFLR